MSRLRKGDSVVLGDDQVSEFKEAFELFDSNRTGFITKDSLRNTLKQFGIRVEPESFEEMFNEADATGHGKIAFPEFMAMMGRRMKQTSTEEILRGAFRVWDPSGSGFIPAKTISTALTSLAEPLSKPELAEFIGLTETQDKTQVIYDSFINTLFTKNH